jgi:hypothetical protein
MYAANDQLEAFFNLVQNTLTNLIVVIRQYSLVYVFNRKLLSSPQTLL